MMDPLIHIFHTSPLRDGIGETDSIPLPAVVPLGKKACFPRQRRTTYAPPLLGAYPDPAREQVRITFPEGFGTGTLEVFDSQGRLVSTLPLGGRKTFAEMDLRGLSEGLYLVRLVFEGMAVADTKFTLLR